MEFPVEIHEKYLKIAEELKIDPDHIEEHHTRGGGPGGQKINKATNCVELHHKPTGIDVRYQHHRGLLANRKGAYKLMIQKIEEYYKGVESELGKRAFKIRKQKQRRTRRSKEKMLEEKKKRGEIKESRKKITNGD